MRVLVTGGRTFTDTEGAFGVLNDLHSRQPITAIIHGGANGADAIAGYWADVHDVPQERFPADWTTHGRKAGPIRNQRMIDEGRPDLVVAFPGGRGTADCVSRALRAELPVRRIAA